MAKGPLDLLDVALALGAPAGTQEERPKTEPFAEEPTQSAEGPTDETPETIVGEIVCGYRALSRLDAGAHAEVYLGAHQYLGVRCAIKVLKEEYSEMELVRRRFHREAQAILQLDHPNVVKLLSAGETSRGRLCIVLEYLEGRTLYDAIIAEAPFPEVRVRALGAQVARGLAAIHEAGLIHRDIKPGNIMLIGPAQVKILDLGLVRFEDRMELTRLTQPGIMLGTPAYMAPEQVEGGEVGSAADCWALGVVLFTMSTGALPGEAKMIGPLAPLVQRLMDPDPKKRPSAREVSAILEPPRRREGARWILPLVLVAAATAVTTAVVIEAPPPIRISVPPPPIVTPPEDVVATPRPLPQPVNQPPSIKKAPEKKKRVRRFDAPSEPVKIEEPPPPVDAMSIEARLDRILVKLRRLNGRADDTAIRALETRYLELRKAVTRDVEPRPERAVEAEDLEKRIDRLSPR